MRYEVWGTYDMYESLPSPYSGEETSTRNQIEKDAVSGIRYHM